MDGYDVITSDGDKVGRVVGTDGGNLVVEHGWVRKSRHVVPQAFASTDREQHVVRLTVPRQVLEDGPTANGDIDEKEVAAYYGLAAGEDAPATQGYGELAPDDPARGAEHDARRAGIEPAEQQRARIRESMRPGAGDEAPRKGARGVHQDYWKTKE
jgi:hypothetical protein